MIMLLNWLLSIITFGTFSLATISMTNVDEYTYETVTNSGITLIDLFGETSAFDGTGYNLIINGDFNTDTIWYTNDASYTHQNDYFTVTPTAYSGGIRQNNTGDIITDNIYYLSFNYRSSALTNDIGFGLGGYNTLLNTYSTEWNTVSCLWTSVYTGNGSTWRFNYIDSNLLSFDLDNVMVYDLTDIFGTGNEPTANEMDTWYALYQTALTTDQHEYTYTLNTIDLEDIVVLVSSAFLWYVAIKLFREVI